MNLLGAMGTANECAKKKLDAHIFMLVHDSVVALVREDQVDEYCEILKRNTQTDRGCSIPGFPIGVDQDIGDDYSFGHFEEVYALSNSKLVNKNNASLELGNELFEEDDELIGDSVASV